ncbi:MalY/PatB family protein [Streptomyces sp. NPDC088847]|uniref:MalY/PatB family protein n=1 Tax=Streptomyces sp. NPDC088847 TaxID=3365909 RepID=UPI00381B914E
MDQHADRLTAEPFDQLRLRRSAKWRTYAPDVIPLTVAEMDFALAEPVRETLHEAVDRSDTGYAMPAPDLGQAVASFAARRWKWEIDPRAVTAVTDVSVGIAQLLRVLAAPGDAVLISPPVYSPFYDLVEEVGARVYEVPLAHDPAQGWRLDLHALESAFAKRPAAYVLCNPHNPVGRAHRPNELAALVELAARHEVPIISDEIHAPLTLPGVSFTPLLSLPGAAAVAVSLISASKAWNLAGLKCAGVVTGSKRMQEVVERFPADARWRIGHFGALATVTAFTKGEQWLDQLLHTLADNRSLLTNLIGTQLPGITWLPPEATYLAWLNCAALGIGDGTAVRDRFLEHGRVAVTPGPGFGSPGGSHVRLNFATGPHILAEAIAGMAKALTV